MHKTTSFKVQEALGNYCRTGLNAPESSIDVNINQYRKLVYNAIEDALDRAFPITRKLIGDNNWKKLITTFIATNKCQSPQIWKLPFELYNYVEQGKSQLELEFEFIKELMHYEWLEIEIFMMEDAFIPSFQKEGNLEKDIFVANPEIKILSLSYPIHTKNVKNINKTDKGQYFASIHRDFYSKKVKFNDLSYPFVQLLLKIHDSDTKFCNLESILYTFDKNEKLNKERISKFLNFAIENNLILGFKKSTNQLINN